MSNKIDEETSKILGSLGKKKKKTVKERAHLPGEDEEGIIYLKDVPDPDQDCKYFEITETLLKYITNTSRKTYEYKEYIQFVKNNLDVNVCSFYENYSMEDGYTIELHHAPFTLFDICKTVANRHYETNGYIETFKVTEEVALLHFTFKVSLTPLNPTAHELVHSGVLKIHPKICINEGWKDFYEEYNPYMTEDIIYKYQEFRKLSEEEENPSFPKVIEYKPIKLVVEGQQKVITEKSLNLLIETSKMNQFRQLEGAA